MHYNVTEKIELLQRELNLDYLAVLTSDTSRIEKIDYFSSNKEWGNLYYENKLILDCPLVKTGLKIRSPMYLLPWMSVPSITNREKLITNLRKYDFNIIHGISVVYKSLGKTISIAVGTSYNTLDFYNEVCNNEATANLLIETLKNGFISTTQ